MLSWCAKVMLWAGVVRDSDETNTAAEHGNNDAG